MRLSPFHSKKRLTLQILAFLFILSYMFSSIVFLRSVEGATSNTQPMKEKTFYLHTLNETRNVGPIATRYIMDSIVGDSGDSITSNMRIIARWFLFPELAGFLQLEGNVTFVLWYMAQGTLDGATWVLTLSEIAKDGNITLIQTAEKDLPSDPSVLTETSITASINYTLQPGSTLEAHINIKGNSATDYTIAWGNSTYNSRIILPAKNYMQILPAAESGVWTLDSGLHVQSNFDPQSENKTIYIRVKVTNPFGGYDIRWVNVTVEAPDGMIIPELNNISASKISGYFNSFESVFQVSWNYSGYPEGRYNITVYALDNNGYFSYVTMGSFGVHLEIDDSGVFFIGAPPIEVNIRIFDGDGEPLEGASVLIILGEEIQASGTTNSSGYVKVNLASGNYRVEVWWQQTLVGWEGLFAEDNWPYDKPFTITAAVYSVSFRAVDVRGAPLEDAAISLCYPNGNVTDEPFVADDQGIVSLGKSPGGTYGVVVVWRGKVVADETVFLDVSKIIDVNCQVYYVNFYTEDADEEKVENALITVSDPLFGTVVEAKLTNASGWLASRLPAGSYEVSVKWFGVYVLEGENLIVENDTNVFLTLSIYTVRIIPVDSKGLMLKDATVSVSSGVFSQSGNTFDEGNVDLKLPVGNYTVKVNWQNVEVFSDTVTVNGTQPIITLKTKVFYLTVQVYDSVRAPLKGVFVTVAKDGTTVGAANTDALGRVEFRLAMGTYVVEASFKTTYYLTTYSDVETVTVNLENNKNTEVVFTSFPIPFYTTVLFYLLTLIGVALTSITLLYLFKFRGVIQ